MYYKKIILWIQIVIDWFPCLKQLEAMDLYIGFMVDDVSSCPVDIIISSSQH